MDEGCYFRINGYWKKLNDKVRKKNNVLYKNTYLIFEALNFNLLVVRICMSYLILRLMIDDDDCLEMHIRLEFSTTLVLKVLRLGFISLPPSIPIVSVIDSKCCLHEINRLPPPVYETNSCTYLFNTIYYYLLLPITTTTYSIPTYSNSSERSVLSYKRYASHLWLSNYRWYWPVFIYQQMFCSSVRSFVLVN